MDYFNFITDKKIIQSFKASSLEDISKLEAELSFKLPEALKVYLLITGESSELYSQCDHHGTKDILYLQEWIYEWISRYKNEGIELSLDNILPFFKWQDTFFYVPIENDMDNPPVYAFDIGETPEIIKVSDSFTDFIKDLYNKKLSAAS